MRLIITLIAVIVYISLKLVKLLDPRKPATVISLNERKRKSIKDEDHTKQMG